jgi:hypothetical protein
MLDTRISVSTLETTPVPVLPTLIKIFFYKDFVLQSTFNQFTESGMNIYGHLTNTATSFEKT